MESVNFQVRLDKEDKEKAAEILDGLGTNLSAAVNMLVKQIIIHNGLPFEVKNDKTDSDEVMRVMKELLRES